VVEEVKSYTVTFERDESGRWVAEVPAVPGCYTQGRTIDQARDRIREALGLFIGERAARVVLLDEVKLPARLSKQLGSALDARKRADAEAQRASEQTKQVAKALAAEGLSLHDVGTLLGISKQGVHKLTG